MNLNAIYNNVKGRMIFLLNKRKYPFKKNLELSNFSNNPQIINKIQNNNTRYFTMIEKIVIKNVFEKQYNKYETTSAAHDFCGGSDEIGIKNRIDDLYQYEIEKSPIVFTNLLLSVK